MESDWLGVRLPDNDDDGTPEEVFDDEDDSDSVDATDREVDTFSEDERSTDRVMLLLGNSVAVNDLVLL